MSEDLTKECNNYQKIFAKFTLRMRRQTPMSTYSESNCSVKLPDPPLLTDGKDPKFEDWLVQMKSKLKANADHYNDESLRMAYVQSRLGRKSHGPRSTLIL